ncbi:glycerophosphodiester phosphodiesterase [Peptoniphilus mikwangii]|uniref:glycerophosphodiester phosphodiesterase n=1 Tax=Peptoniphilus mikwangii TaxID=1354300 RepID=UPI000424B15F|nr:glycerophosphodiester phosphodiesterase [Peptoniphilus mikwangii]
MLNIAHRGFKSRYPENTMLAFKKAVETGADGIEFDVHLSKDGEIVIIHDERLDRTTDKSGRIMDFSLDELKSANAANLYKDIEFEAIPTLREYFEYISDKKLITNIELKTGIYWYDGIEEKVYRMIKEFDIQDKIIISSFNHNSVLKMKEIDKNIKCGLLVACWLNKPWEYVKKLGVEYYHPAAYAVDKEMVKGLHDNGIGINVWYGMEPYDFKTTFDLGVDALITDYPDVIKTFK